MEIKKKVELALDMIRPQMAEDGGDVELIGVVGNAVKVKITGNCRGCPSEITHLQRAIRTALKAGVPEINELIYVYPDGKERSTTPSDTDPYAGQKRIEHVKLIIAVASAKGGVGKSTVAVNLALALAQKGLKIGLLDADIYGPSMPTMLGISEPPITAHRHLKPASKYGIKAMSIGFYVKQASAMIWRGPMVMKAIDQFLNDVEWGELDCLVVDLPPGTGDAQISLAQRVPLDGVVIVTTPSDVALVDVRRGHEMFRKLGIRVLGIVENMSYFLCPHCGERTNVFSAGGGKTTAEEVKSKLLGEIPLDPYIRSTGDSGKPTMVADEHSPQATKLRKISDTIWSEIETQIPGWDMSACHLYMPARKAIEEFREKVKES